MNKRYLSRFTTIFISILMMALSFRGEAQLTEVDIELLRARNFTEQLPATRNVAVMLVGKNAMTRYNPLSLLFTGSLFVYQKVISAQIGADCPYEISCSEFSRKCIQEYGLFKGVALAADRLTRCNEIAAYDIHPILINDDQRIRDSVGQYRNKD